MCIKYSKDYKMNQDAKPKKKYYRRKKGSRSNDKSNVSSNTNSTANSPAGSVTNSNVSSRSGTPTPIIAPMKPTDPIRQHHIEQCEYQLGRQFKLYKQNKSFTQFGFIPGNFTLNNQQDKSLKTKFFINVPRDYPHKPIKITSNVQDDKIMQHKLNLCNLQMKDNKWLQEPLLAKLNMLLTYMNTDSVSINTQGNLIDSHNLTKLFYQQLQ